MNRSYSISEARNNLASIVHYVEEASAIELTHRGRPVAVLLSIEEYRRLAAGEKDLWGAYTEFRRTFDLRQLDIEPEVFEGLRDSSPGREAP